MTNLTVSEKDLLLWLSREDFSQHSECHGSMRNEPDETKRAVVQLRQDFNSTQ
jgi:hypothetical protein